ncbi:MAG TPA: response regulator [Candidatus Aquilonibacter sp.]|nr:response regulator [Candidatus Aquilonibacter sp.]
MPKILVADDNTNIQKMVSLAFEERGIDVVSVGNGEAAVRRIPDMNPDLVLADIFMPVRNGYEVCEFVKKDERFSHVPVILLVGAFDPLDEKEARRVGADGVLKKPFVPPDPLIAMVISALEKNPRIAAEMAKAKEVVPEPEPMPAALEMPAKAEIKPLPEFPEPSPEEAALVYGFGSGKRGNEDVAESKAPVSPGVDAEEEDSDDDMSTHDWRRSAMDLEIPEETSKTTAFALDDEPATAMFPSEKEVPPKHVDVKKVAKIFEAESVTKIAPVVPAGAPVLPAVAPPPTPTPLAVSVPAGQTVEPVEAPDSFLTATMLGTDPVVPVVPPTTSLSAPVAAPAAKSVPESSIKEPETSEVKSAIASAPAAAIAEKASETPVLEIEQAPEPTFASRAAHWMDAMTAALKEPEEQGWADPAPPVKMDLDAKGPSSEPLAKIEVQAPEPAPVSAPPPVVEAHTVSASTPTPPALSEELPLSTEPVEPEKDEAFFADDESSAPQWIPVVATETKKAQIAPNDPALETSAPVPVSHLAADPELIEEEEDASPVAKDPALVEPPSVHVTPEPLLLDDTPAQTASSKYDKREESIPPAFAFTEAPQAPEEHAEAAHDSDAEPEKDERIPTMPPPNREILAEIPFLSPPKEFLEPTAEEDKTEDTKVDDVVRKVLERLEPQLHDLLSQGLLKPLVENIIQNDLTKKGR